LIAVKRSYDSYQKVLPQLSKGFTIAIERQFSPYSNKTDTDILINRTATNNEIMAIKFTVHKTPRPKGSKEDLKHARAIPGGTRRMKDICNIICERSSISSADVKAVLDSFVWYIGFTLKYGEHIELEELGYFSPSLRTQKTPEGKSVVTVDGVNFRCSEKLKKELRSAELEREKSPKSITPQKRKERMLEYFKENETITTPAYATLNACSHYRAKADLDQYLKENIVIRVGSSTHVCFILTKNLRRE
jgi:predicted histone-like DNA-binding protein